ncbi:MAG: hypothetical protein RR053_03550 [Evtepia sp.]
MTVVVVGNAVGQFLADFRQFAEGKQGFDLELTCEDCIRSGNVAIVIVSNHADAAVFEPEVGNPHAVRAVIEVR